MRMSSIKTMIKLFKYSRKMPYIKSIKVAGAFVNSEGMTKNSK